MKIEDIFKNNIKELWYRLAKLEHLYPDLSNALSLKQKDPQAERIINACAMINSNFIYKMEYKISQQIKSILLNLNKNKFNTIPPIGVVKLKLKNDTYLKIKENKTIISNDIIFKTMFNQEFSNVEVLETEVINNKVRIKFFANKPVEFINLYTDIYTINSIFIYSNNVKCGLYEKDNKVLDCDANLDIHYNIETFQHFQKLNCFFKIQNISTIQKEFIIEIPCYDNISNCFFETNCLLIENRFIDSSNPILVNKPGVYPLIQSENTSLIKIYNILNSNNENIQHLNYDSKGWFLNLDNNGYSLYFNSNLNSMIYTQTECYNKNIKVDNKIYFEEFFPINISWIQKPCMPKKYENNIEINKMILCFNNEYFDNLETYVKSIFNLYNIQLSDLYIIDSIKPKIVKNFSATEIGKNVFLTTNIDNFILLKLITREIQNNFNYFIDFTITTDKGEILYEQ